jgi:GAF domain-containing protein
MRSATETSATTAEETLVHALRNYLASSRVTLRLRRGGQVALVAESLAPGVISMRAGTQEDAAQFPTYQHLEHTRQVLVQDDLITDPIRPPQSLIEEYHTNAQMLAPITIGQDMIGVISVHQVGAGRHWGDDEIAALSAAATSVALLERLDDATPE